MRTEVQDPLVIVGDPFEFSVTVIEDHDNVILRAGPVSFHLMPYTMEDADAYLAWADRAEAALDETVSALRVIRERMERSRVLLAALDAADNGARGAGASVEADRG